MDLNTHKHHIRKALERQKRILAAPEFRRLTIEEFRALETPQQNDYLSAAENEVVRLDYEERTLNSLLRLAFDKCDRELVRNLRKRQSEIADDILMLKIFAVHLRLATEVDYLEPGRAALPGYAEAARQVRELEAECQRVTKCTGTTHPDQGAALEELRRLQPLLEKAQQEVEKLAPIPAVKNPAFGELRAKLNDLLDEAVGNRKDIGTWRPR
jgi:hypothetical protein